MKFFIITFSILCFSGVNVFSNDLPVVIKSPNEKLIFFFNFDSSQKLTYSVQYERKNVIMLSKLGVSGWMENLTLAGIKEIQKDTVWKTIYGERALVRDNYNAKNISFMRNNNPRYILQLEVRAYGEGIAFRYFFPESLNGGRDTNITSEKNQFTMPRGTQAWFTLRARARAQTAYTLLPLSDCPGECECSLVLQLNNGLFACLAEAQVDDYCRRKFTVSEEQANTISCSMLGPSELTSPFSTPWKVIMVAEEAGQLLENNDIILNLNPPCEIANTAWIKPKKVMREVTLSAQGAKVLVDFAVKHKLQYIHFDAGWYGYEYVVGSDASTVTVDPKRNPNSDLNLQETIHYANEKGVGVILYVNQRALYKQLDQILPLYKEWGVRGIKFGFVHVGSHRWTTWMHDAVKKCADYNLLVDIHDENRPTGFSRTYLNLMTQEGIRGNEDMSDANHNTVLPFARFIAGAGDYTFCYYSREEFAHAKRHIQNIAGHQLALPVVCYSPLQWMYWYDKSSDYLGEPELELWDMSPTVCDETYVVQDEIGQDVTFARRSGDNWFLGTITNNDAHNLKVTFDFLTKGKSTQQVFIPTIVQ
jgi:alpha-glucosidase